MQVYKIEFSNQIATKLATKHKRGPQMADMTKDLGHLNGLARTLGIRPKCRQMATEDELAFVAEWMRLRTAAYLEEVAHDAQDGGARRAVPSN